MIWKTREVPIERERIEVLLRRLPKSHSSYKQVETEFWNVTSGFAGETRFDEYFSANIPAFPHIVLHDVLLKSTLSFQLDSLMITPWCLYVFEVKNISGRLHFKSYPQQLIQTKDDGSVIGRKSPIEQIERNEWLLEEWLQQREIFLPIRSVLVLSYPKQIPENVPTEQTTIFSHQLPIFLKKIQPQKALMASKEMEDLASEMAASHSPFIANPICANPAYPIDAMLRGVWCAGCSRIGMKRKYGAWHCPDCGVSSKDAHVRTIKDWLLLTGEPMTNKTCREILQIEDRHLAKRCLGMTETKKQGNYKSTNYVLETS